MYPVVQKKHYRVILDIEAYDDLDVKNLDWSNVLKLEGDECVDAAVTILDYDHVY